MSLPVDFIGEHPIPGIVGNISIIAAFVTSILASYSFWRHTRDETQLDWKKLGQWAFGLHAGFIFIIVGTLFYIIINHLLEYRYAYAHTSEDLPFKYIFSAFWEDQEGSFTLWMFWHAVLGLIILKRNTVWTSGVLFVLSLIQVFLVMMLLGIYIPWFGESVRIGSNPFIYLRDTMVAPIFNNASYLTLIKGTGLSPLLQNYWMTIHPPTLFLGFASTAIPFCYAVASLLRKEYTAWLKPALRWSLFSAGILGLGILMGGAWAYEALSFGGYWAWDPVENSSLAPWIILVAGIHTNLVANVTKRAIKSTYLFYGGTFLLVLYSTTLTRSGILGDTSVHAFTEMGLEWQLLAFILFFIGLFLIPFFINRKKIPVPEKEERSSSREFWMVLGSLILLLSTILIMFTTSIPVINKIIDVFAWLSNTNFDHYHRTAPIDPVAHHNGFQMWIAMFIVVLSSFGVFLKYRQPFWQSHNRSFLKSIGLAIGISLIFAAITFKSFSAYGWHYVLLYALAIFGAVANVIYLFTDKITRTKVWSVFGHIGFALMVIGILFSGLHKEYISTNAFLNRGLVSSENLDKNVLLYKNVPLKIKGFDVTYTGDTLVSFTRTFNVVFDKKNEEGKSIEKFNLTPSVLYDKSFKKIASPNPSTKRYIHKDIFSHIVALPKSVQDLTLERTMDDSLTYKAYTLKLKDTIFTQTHFIILNDITNSPTQAGLVSTKYIPQDGDMAIATEVLIGDATGIIDTIHPTTVVRGNLIYRFPEQSNVGQLRIKIPDQFMERQLNENLDNNAALLTFKDGESQPWEDYDVKFNGFNNAPSHPTYHPIEGDLAVSAQLEISKDGQVIGTSEPIYLIRNSQVFQYNDVLTSENLTFRFHQIDPLNKKIQIAALSANRIPDDIEVEVAEDAPRDDFIVLEAIIFPGINLFWLGTLMSLAGLFLGWLDRRKNKLD